MLAAATSKADKNEKKEKESVGGRIREGDVRLMLDGKVLEDSERCEDVGLEDDMVVMAVYREGDGWEEVNVPSMEEEVKQES